MTTLYLIRHGETPWNVEGRYQGQQNPSLTERGQHQAQLAAEHLQTFGFHAIYSSDLARAHETARPLADKLGLPIHIDARLREICQGDWEGMLFSDIQARWSAEVKRWRDEPWASCPPGGERLHELQARVYEAIDEIVAKHPNQRVAVFTHKLPIALLKIRFQGHRPEKLWTLLPPNTAWETFEIDSGNSDGSYHKEDARALQASYERLSIGANGAGVT